MKVIFIVLTPVALHCVFNSLMQFLNIFIGQEKLIKRDRVFISAFILSSRQAYIFLSFQTETMDTERVIVLQLIKNRSTAALRWQEAKQNNGPNATEIEKTGRSYHVGKPSLDLKPDSAVLFEINGRFACVTE